MSSDDPTALAQEQVKSPGHLSAHTALWLRKYSTQFGWPALILYTVSPEGFWTGWVAQKGTWIAGTVLLLLALTLRLASKGFDRKNFVWSGAYRHVRNPVEVGALIAYCGGGLILKIHPLIIVLIVLAAFGYMSWNSFYYEKELLRKVGPSYIKYMRRVRRWIPSLLPGVNRSNQDYSLRLALFQEKDSLLWIVGFGIVYSFRNHLF